MRKRYIDSAFWRGTVVVQRIACPICFSASSYLLWEALQLARWDLIAVNAASAAVNIFCGYFNWFVFTIKGDNHA